MKVLGITGGIGSGKSVLLNAISEIEGCFVCEADALAKELMKTDMPAYNAVVKVFGDEIVGKDRSIISEKLGAIVFSNKRMLEKLNMTVHPVVKDYILNDIEEKKTDYRLYVIEAALLIEDGYKEICDEIWYIYVDEDERIKRLINGRGGTKEKWKAVIKSQSGSDYYRANSDRTIDNNKPVELVKKETIEAVNELLN